MTEKIGMGTKIKNVMMSGHMNSWYVKKNNGHRKSSYGPKNVICYDYGAPNKLLWGKE